LSTVETLRDSFRPEQITTLFVGESPPARGTFFYKGDSLLYRQMKQAFASSADFLPEFKAKGFFLDDLVLYAVNQMDEKERNEHRWKGLPLLAERMRDYQPMAVVALMIAIEEMVREAMSKAGLSNVTLHVVPFPHPGNQKRFKARMAEIIPKLPTTKHGD
jgi:hypothetical protein